MENGSTDSRSLQRNRHGSLEKWSPFSSRNLATTKRQVLVARNETPLSTTHPLLSILLSAQPPSSATDDITTANNITSVCTMGMRCYRSFREHGRWELIYFNSGRLDFQARLYTCRIEHWLGDNSKILSGPIRTIWNSLRNHHWPRDEFLGSCSHRVPSQSEYSSYSNDPI